MKVLAVAGIVLLILIAFVIIFYTVTYFANVISDNRRQKAPWTIAEVSEKGEIVIYLHKEDEGWLLVGSCDPALDSFELDIEELRMTAEYKKNALNNGKKITS